MTSLLDASDARARTARTACQDRVRDEDIRVRDVLAAGSVHGFGSLIET